MTLVFVTPLRHTALMTATSTERLQWELDVAIPHELANTTNARRRARLIRDRAAIERELIARQPAGTNNTEERTSP